MARSLKMGSSLSNRLGTLAAKHLFCGIALFLLGQLIPAHSGDLAPNEKVLKNCQSITNGFATAKEQYILMAECAAFQAKLPPQIAIAVMEIESNFNPKARGADGEIGLMQIMPPTARMLGFSGSLKQLEEPRTNITLGVRYLAEAFKLGNGDLCTAVMKYRAGHGETRFSVLSVEYCKRARAILLREGILMSGEIPKPTFGFDRGKSKVGTSCTRRSFVPGPGYGKCMHKTTNRSTSKTIAQRRALFGN